MTAEAIIGPPKAPVKTLPAKAAIPVELTGRAQWVAWRAEVQANGKIKKIPVNPRTGKDAKSNDPKTWATFDEAASWCKRNDLMGIGYVFSENDPFFGCDLDGCHNKETGQWTAWAWDMIQQFGTYAEVSPSRTGAKFIGRGKLPNNDAIKTTEIELYATGRFFTVTGWQVEGTPLSITDCQAQLTELCRNLAPQARKQSSADVPEIIPSGQQNNVLVSRAGRWWNDGMPADALRAAMHVIGEQNCVPAADPKRVDQIVNWVITKERNYTLWSSNGHAQSNDVTPVETVPPNGKEARPPFPYREFPRTDSGNGEAFTYLYGDRLRYDYLRGRWLVWQGHWWQPDPDGEVSRLAKAMARWRYSVAPDIADLDAREKEAKWAIVSEMQPRLDATLKRARSERPIADAGRDWDADPMLLGVANGVMELKTGQRRDGRPEDRITIHTDIAYDPTAECPTFLEYLRHIFNGNAELIRFLQKAIGYGITGSTVEQVVFILYGEGQNGKSTLLELLLDLLGEYATQAAPDLLLAQRKDSHPTGIADLANRRIVTAVETGQGQKMAESLVKQMAGSDTMKGRQMRQDYFMFRPTHTVFLATNHKPIIRDRTLGMWRKLRMIPFTVKIEQPDHELPTKLRAEMPGILRWAVEGCLLWQDEGLGMPADVENATAAYREEMDTLAAFIGDCCELAERATVPAAGLFNAYADWCRAGHEQGLSRREFGAALEERGIKHGRTNSARLWVGIRLATTASQLAMSDESDKVTESDAKTGMTENLKSHEGLIPENASPSVTLSQAGLPDEPGTVPCTGCGVDMYHEGDGDPLCRSCSEWAEVPA